MYNTNHTPTPCITFWEREEEVPKGRREIPHHVHIPPRDVNHPRRNVCFYCYYACPPHCFHIYVLMAFWKEEGYNGTHHLDKRRNRKRGKGLQWSQSLHRDKQNQRHFSGNFIRIPPSSFSLAPSEHIRESFDNGTNFQHPFLFRSRCYHLISFLLLHRHKGNFTSKWKPSPACQFYQNTKPSKHNSSLTMQANLDLRTICHRAFLSRIHSLVTVMHLGSSWPTPP